MLERMGEGSVSKVVAQACQLRELEVVPGDAQLGLLCLQAADELSCQVAHSKGVLEAVVRSAREDQVGSTQLLKVSKSLEVRSVHNLQAIVRDFNVAMDWVVDDLPGSHSHIPAHGTSHHTPAHAEKQLRIICMASGRAAIVTQKPPVFL